MSIGSHAQKRLSNLYRGILQNMHVLEWLMEHGIRSLTRPEPVAAVLEQYEPRLLMSGAPAAPTDLLAAPVSISHVSLSWQDSAADQTGFKVYESTDGLTFSLLDTVSDPDQDSYCVGGLAAGTQYFFEVSAISADGESDLTAAAIVTTPATAADDAATAVDSRLADKTPTMALPLWSAMNTASSPHTFTWNANSWAADLDFTCVSPWNSYFPNAGGEKGGTLISPRQIIFTKHFPLAVGNQIDFVTSAGQTVSRSIVNVTDVANTDLSIGLLDSDVPAGVMPASVLPADYADYFPSDGSEIPVVRMNAAKQAGVWQTTMAETTGSSSVGTYTALEFTHPDSVLAPDQAAFSTTVVAGDSGSPCFIILNDTPVLVSLVTAGTDSLFNGPMVSAYLDAINQAMLAQDQAYNLDTATYQLNVLDLAALGYQTVSLQTDPNTNTQTNTQTSLGPPVVTGCTVVSLHFVLDGENLGGLVAKDVEFWVHSGGSWILVPTEDIGVTNVGDTQASIGYTGNLQEYPGGVDAIGLTIPGLSLTGMTTVIPVLPGDADRSELVDQDDYKIWYDNYGTGTTWEQGNFKNYGKTDQDDYKTWYDHYGASVDDPELPPAPDEPSVSAVTWNQDGSVNLQWDGLYSTQTGFHVYGSATREEGSYVLLAIVALNTSTGCTIEAQDVGDNAWFKVKSFNLAGESAGEVHGKLAASDLVVTSSSPTLVNLYAEANYPGGQNGLTYTWTATGPAGVSFSSLGTSAARRTTAVFSAAGTYNVTVAITDQDGLSVQKSRTVQVDPVATRLTITNPCGSLQAGVSRDFAVEAADQFGVTMSTPTIVWTKVSGVGSLDSVGHYVAPSDGSGMVEIRASSGTLRATCDFSLRAPVTSEVAAHVVSTDSCSAILEAVGDDQGAAITYSWAKSSGPGTVTFMADPSIAGRTTATFSKAGTYNLVVTVTDADNFNCTENVNGVTFTAVASQIQTADSLRIVKSTRYSLTATIVDQFGDPMSPQPSLTWAVTGGNGVMDGSSYLAPAGTTGGDAIRVTASGLQKDVPLVLSDSAFSDNFDRSDARPIGSPWVQEKGTLQISSNAGASYLTGSSSESISFCDSISLADVAVTALVNVTSSTSGEAGVLARATSGTDSSRSFYMARLRKSSNNYYIDLCKKLSGSTTITQLASAAISGGPGELRFEIRGNVLTALWNGTVVASVIDTSITTAGGAGVRTYTSQTGAAFDDFSVEAAPTTSNQSLPFSDNFSRPTSHFLGDGWIDASGPFVISGSALRNFSASAPGTYEATVSGISAADVSASTNVDLSSSSADGGRGGIALRASASGAYRGYVKRSGSSLSAYIYRRSNSSETLLISTNDVSTDLQGSLRFEASGQFLRLFYNDVLVAYCQDGNITAAGSVGVVAQKDIAFDDFAAAALATPTPGNATLPFQDDFGRASGTFLGGDWATQDGGFAVTGGSAVSTSSGAVTASLAGITSASDVSMSAVVDTMATFPAAAGLKLRVMPSSSYLARLWHDSDFPGPEFVVEIWRQVGGSWTQLAESPVGKGTGDLRFDAIGSRLSVFLDGELVVSAVDTSNTSGGVQLYAYNNKMIFDHVIVSDASSPAPQTPSLPFSDDFNRDLGGRLGAEWTQQEGCFAISGNALRTELDDQVSPYEYRSVATLNGSRSGDVSVSVAYDITAAGTSRAGIVLRSVVGSVDYTVAHVFQNGGKSYVQVSRNQAGTWTDLISGSGIEFPGYGKGVLKVDIVGSTASIYVDGKLITTVNVSSIPSEGRVGLYAYAPQGHASFDDFTAEPLASPAASAVWNAISSGSEAALSYWDPARALSNVLVGDFDGDGRADMVGYDPATGVWLVGRASGVADFTTETWGSWSTSVTWADVVVGDFDGDGRDDVAGRNTATGTWTVSFSDGSSFHNFAGDTWPTSATWGNVTVGDFDMDGRSDIVGCNSAGQWRVTQYDGQVFAGRTRTALSGSGAWQDILSGDFDGDGRDDLAAYDPSTGSWNVSISGEMEAWKIAWATLDPSATWVPTVGDFNGDGLADIAAHKIGTTNWKALYSTGHDFTSVAFNASDLAAVAAADLNGDGKADVVGQVPGTAVWRALISQGGSFADQSWITYPTSISPAGTRIGNFRNLAGRAAGALEDVYDSVQYVPYYGLMRGVEATRQTRGGNDWDQAALLKHGLEAIGIRCRFASGRVDASASDVQAWLGAKDSSAAEAILDAAGMNASRTGSGTGERIQFDHAWLQAYMPGQSGLTWKDIDPSFKAKNAHVDILNVLDQFPFDRTSFLSHVRTESPLEYYQDGLARWLAATHPGTSVADVRLDGPIVAKVFDALPPLPFNIVTVTATYDLTPMVMTHRATLTLYVSSPSSPEMSLSLSVPDLGTRTLIVSYLVTAQGLVPQILIDGEVVATGPNVLTSGSDISLDISHFNAGDNTVDHTSTYHRLVGQHLAVGLQGDQFSIAANNDLQMRANEEALAYKDSSGDPLPAFDDGLSLAIAEYFRRVSGDEATIASYAGLTKVVTGVWDGVMTADATDIEFHWDMPLPVVSPSTYIDIKYAPDVLRAVSSEIDLPSAQSSAKHFDAMNASLYESYVLEEMFNAEGISTTKGFEMANEDAIPTAFVTSVSQVAGLSISQHAKDSITTWLNAGYQVTVVNGTITLPQWSETVFEIERGSGDSLTIGEIVCGDTNGGILGGLINAFRGLMQWLHQNLEGDPVNVATGAFTRSEVDISIPNAGIPFKFERSYSSSSMSDIGMGVGWTFSYSDRLDVSAGDVTWTDSGGSSFLFSPDGLGGYASTDSYSTLSEVTGGYLIRDRDGFRRRFNTQGRLVELLDANDNSMTVTYDTSGNLDEVYDTHAPTRYLSFTYTNGHIEYVSDFAGRIWHYYYTDLSDPSSSATTTVLSEMVGPTDGVTTTNGFEYNYETSGALFGLLHSIVEPATGRGIQCDYYPNRMAFAVTDPEGNREHFTYDSYHSRTTHIDPLGTESTQILDGLGVTGKNIHADGTWEQHLRSGANEYGAVNSLGYAEVNDFDAIGNLVRQAASDGLVTEYQYETVFYQPTVITHPGGATIVNGYDSHGNLTSVEDSMHNVTTMTYYSSGLLWTQTLPKGNLPNPDGDYTTTFSNYDESGKPGVIQNGLTGHTTNTYDARGNLLTTQDPTGVITTYTYDLLDRRLTVTLPDPDGAGPLGPLALSYGYDGSNVAMFTDPNGNVTVARFDGNGRQVEAVNPDGTRTMQVFDAAGNMVRQVDELGRTTRFFYDQRNYLVEVVTPDGASTLERYDAMGNVVATTNARGYTTTFTYDSAGRNLTAADPLGLVVANQYDQVGRLAKQTTVRGVTTFAYDDMDRVVDVRRPAGVIETFDYDANGNLWKDIQYETTGLAWIPSDPRTLPAARQRVLEMQYDVANRLWRSIDPELNTRETSYDDAGRVLTTTDQLGNVTTYGYDDAGRLKSVTLPDPDDGGPLLAPVAEYVLDANGNVIQLTDPNGHVTSYGYDSRGRQVSSVNALTETATMIYDVASQFVSQTDVAGRTTIFNYDPCGRMIRQQQADPDAAGALLPPVSRRGYDADGNLAWSIDPLGAVTTYEYDPLERCIMTVLPDPDGPTGPLISPVTENHYLGYDLVETVDALGFITTYSYDAAGRQTGRTLPDPDGTGSLVASTTLTGYDSLGNMIFTTDAASNTTTYQYDKMNRRTAMVLPDPDGAGPKTESTTTYQYDAAGNLRFTTDALSKVTEDQYDNLNRRILEILPDPDDSGPLTSPTTSFTYDPVGNLLTQTDPDGNTNTYQYDELNRIEQETNESGQSRFYTYADGYLESVTDRNGRTREFGYDRLGRQITETWVGGGNVIESSYDAAGRLISTEDDFSSNTYQYDAIGRLLATDATLPDAQHVVLTSSYDAAGRRTSLAAVVDGTADFVNGYLYDDAGRLTRLTQAQAVGGNSVAEKRVDLTYVQTGQYLSVNRFSDIAGLTSVANTAYSYDGWNRLTALTHRRGGTTISAYTWDFDARGRLVTQSSPDGSSTYTYDNNGQLKAADHQNQPDEGYSYDANGNRTGTGYDVRDDNRLAADDTYSYTYDNEGNLIERDNRNTGEVVTYTWDFRNRLVTVEMDDGASNITEATYVYDVSNRRIAKYILENSVLQSATEFAYDGQDVILTFDENGTIQHRYLVGPKIDQVFADEDAAGSVKWLLADNQGSVRDVINNSGVAINHVVYSSFGKIVSQTNPSASVAYGFTGREYDPETGLYYYRLRYYSADSGRFISEDPIGFNGGDTNLYRYVGNSPTNATDPMGTMLVRVWNPPDQTEPRRANPVARYVQNYDYEGESEPQRGLKLFTRLGGLLQAIGGIIEIGAGFALAEVPPLGAFIVVHGADQAFAGIMILLTGEYHQTLSSSLIQQFFGMSQQSADMTNALISMIFTLGAGSTVTGSVVLADGTVVPISIAISDAAAGGAAIEGLGGIINELSGSDGGSTGPEDGTPVEPLRNTHESLQEALDDAGVYEYDYCYTEPVNTSTEAGRQLVAQGYTEIVYAVDYYGTQYTVAFNPTTQEYVFFHPSSGLP